MTRRTAERAEAQQSFSFRFHFLFTLSSPHARAFIRKWTMESSFPRKKNCSTKRKFEKKNRKNNPEQESVIHSFTTRKLAYAHIVSRAEEKTKRKKKKKTTEKKDPMSAFVMRDGRGLRVDDCTYVCVYIPIHI